MTYQNISEYWGDVGESVTPQWYEGRAKAMGIKTTTTYNAETDEETGTNYPAVVTTRLGLVIDGEVVAVVIAA